MRSSTERVGGWAPAGVVIGLAGVAVSYLAAAAMNIRASPVIAVAETMIRLTPGGVVEWAISTFGSRDKLVLAVGLGIVLVAVFAGIGTLAARHVRWALLGWVALAVVGGAAVTLEPGPTPIYDQIPTVAGLVAWLVLQHLLTARLERMDAAATEARAHAAIGAPSPEWAAQRRGFLITIGVVAAASGLLGLLGRYAGRGRRQVEEARRLLRLSDVTEPAVPSGVSVGVDGVSSWVTPAQSFYLVDTAIIKPAIEPTGWTLRIHGMVENEVEISYEELVAREVTEDWITLNCVSNPVGGPYIGNAWWSGVRIAPLLEQAGVSSDADAVLQTSQDGWTCGTPVSALTDDRNAMLALAMNGEPLPIEHGFPVRMIVPGLYGYVSACKWVVDLEVTKFSEISAYWTDKGWGEMGPVKMSSRVDVPSSGSQVASGSVVCAGVAWSQTTGIAAVEVSLDGGAWQPADLADVPNDDTWVQWRAEVDAAAGDHLVKVRATDKDGTVQTGVERDVLPDGATGWHEVDFTTFDS